MAGVTLAQLIRLELLAVLVGLALTAHLQGTSLTDPWLSEAIILAILFGASALAVFFGRFIVGGVLGWLISWGAITLAIITANEALSFRSTILPQGQFYTVADAEAVTVKIEVRGNSEIWATVTNRRPDWLRNAVVSCQLYYDNGGPIDRSYSYGVANGYLGQNESASKRVISWQELLERRADPDRTRCTLKYAQFMERPALPIEIAIGYDRTHWRHVFTITNRSSQTIADLLLHCRDENGINQTMNTVGRWSDDPRAGPVVEPGDQAQLVTQDRSFLKLEACAVLSVRGMERHSSIAW